MYDLIVIWRVLDNCNLRCSFCEYSREKEFVRTLPKPQNILPFAQILRQYASQTNRSVCVSWLGGEPFLWKNIFGFSERLREENGLHVSVTTNGTFLYDRRVRERIVHTFDQITISIDGYRNHHDELRLRNGLFEIILNAIQEMNNARKSYSSTLEVIRVNSILNAISVDEFELLCRQLASVGVDEITFNQLIANKESLLYSQRGLTKEHMEKVRALKKLRTSLFEDFGTILLGSDQYFDRIEAYINDKPVPVADCNPGSQILFVDQFGRIGPCSFAVSDTKLHISEIKSVDHLLRLPSTFRNYITALRPSACRDCMDTNVFGKFVNPFAAIEPSPGTGSEQI